MHYGFSHEDINLSLSVGSRHDPDDTEGQTLRTVTSQVWLQVPS